MRSVANAPMNVAVATKEHKAIKRQYFKRRILIPKSNSYSIIYSDENMNVYSEQSGIIISEIIKHPDEGGVEQTEIKDIECVMLKYVGDKLFAKQIGVTT